MSANGVPIRRSLPSPPCELDHGEIREDGSRADARAHAARVEGVVAAERVDDQLVALDVVADGVDDREVGAAHLHDVDVLHDAVDRVDGLERERVGDVRVPMSVIVSVAPSLKTLTSGAVNVSPDGVVTVTTWFVACCDLAGVDRDLLRHRAGQVAER